MPGQMRVLSLRSTDQHLKLHVAFRRLARQKTQVLRPIMCGVLRTPADSDVELAGQVGVDAAADEDSRNIVAKLSRVDQFVGIDAAERVAENVADIVVAGLA